MFMVPIDPGDPGSLEFAQKLSQALPKERADDLMASIAEGVAATNDRKAEERGPNLPGSLHERDCRVDALVRFARMEGQSRVATATMLFGPSAEVVVPMYFGTENFAMLCGMGQSAYRRLLVILREEVRKSVPDRFGDAFVAYHAMARILQVRMEGGELTSLPTPADYASSVSTFITWGKKFALID